MATLRAPSSAFLSAFLSVARSELYPQSQPLLRRIPLLQRLRTSPLLPAALIPIPSLLADLWDGLLKAVPKKKTTHSKKRHRQMAGKALKDVTALNKCSACGRTKRAHVLCPYCVQSEPNSTIQACAAQTLTRSFRHTKMDWQRFHVQGGSRRGRGTAYGQIR